MTDSIHGPATTSATKMPTSLGMKDSVASLIWVAAWKMLTTRPMISATSSIGAAIISVISIACRPNVITLSGVIAHPLVETLGKRAQQQLPAVDQHEQHQLERQRDHRRRHHHHPHRHKDRG